MPSQSKLAIQFYDCPSAFNTIQPVVKYNNMFPLHSHPRGSTGRSTFWCQKKAHIFLIVTPRFQLQIHFTLAVMAENVPISGMQIVDFLMYFHNSLFPSATFLFLPKEFINS